MEGEEVEEVETPRGDQRSESSADVVDLTDGTAGTPAPPPKRQRQSQIQLNTEELVALQRHVRRNHERVLRDMDHIEHEGVHQIVRRGRALQLDKGGINPERTTRRRKKRCGCRLWRNTSVR